MSPTWNALIPIQIRPPRSFCDCSQPMRWQSLLHLNTSNIDDGGKRIHLEGTSHKALYMKCVCLMWNQLPVSWSPRAHNVNRCKAKHRTELHCASKKFKCNDDPHQVILCHNCSNNPVTKSPDLLAYVFIPAHQKGLLPMIESGWCLTCSSALVIAVQKKQADTPSFICWDNWSAFTCQLGGRPLLGTGNPKVLITAV